MHKYSLKWWKAQYRQFNSDEFLVALPRMKREMGIRWKLLKEDQLGNIEPVYSLIMVPIFMLAIGSYAILYNPPSEINFNNSLSLYIYIYIMPGLSLFPRPLEDQYSILFNLMGLVWIGFKLGIEIPFWVKVYYYRKYRKQKLEEEAREID